MKVAAFVQAVESRRALADGIAQQALEAGCSTATALYQKPEQTPWDHFFNVFRAMQDSDAEFVIRFEDDCLLSPHLAHNCLTWDVIHRPRFGVGLLYSPPTSVLDYIYRERPSKPILTRFLAGAVAQLWRRADLEQHIEGMQQLLPEFQAWNYPFDIIVSAHCNDHHWELYTHNPPIVEHLMYPDSAIGNPKVGIRSTEGAFNPKFRR